MKFLLITLVIFTRLNSFAQTGNTCGVFIKFSSKKIKFASRICTLYATDTSKSIVSQNIQIPNDSAYYFLRCNPKVPVRIWQDNCLFPGEIPYPVGEIKVVGKRIYGGDSILVDIDRHTVTLINKHEKD